MLADPPNPDDRVELGPEYVRMLSPYRRRIITINRNDPGTALLITNLVSLGWLAYDGPAVADDRGWVVVPTADERVRPVPFRSRAQ